ncbi:MULTISPECIES: type 1 fimbrial protein [unclassified Pseudomonas]|uniref:type 1 fimbrial protein n=1 Tax=unclassified Pseudomonas TaxID=196821 RepID=UPI002AC9B569|nr:MULTISPECIES: type 1 fimbrial protein [unclassified Pseudomonas]MEB0044895.1 type 1 fimbrial protein [Pseudomonas sp. Dout3]MEB0096093.1 type 1 fimbrial protein [Pseudomonas sp. DC1.2]WPX57954.1 type 1 fimbrial protein [Pseudomonas sp. DC1.2]
MNLKVVVSSVLLLMPLGVSAAPQVSSGQIDFVGQIVDSGCQVGRAGAQSFTQSQRVQVQPGLSLDVDTYRNACGHGTIPFSTAFEPLKASSNGSVSGPESGIITVTYR